MTHFDPRSTPLASMLLTRRQLFKAAGASGIAALSAALPGTHHAAAWKAAAPNAARSQTPTLPLRIGLLLAGSTLHPDMAQAWQMGLLSAVQPLALSTRTLGAGALSGEVARAVQGLIDGHAQLIIGMTEGALLGPADALLGRHGVGFVTSEFGARAIEAPASPHIARSTLGSWQGHWQMGQWLARHQGARAALVMSFHESGYDQPFAFQAGFESAGGQIVATHVCDSPAERCDMQDLRRALTQAKPDLVYVLHSGPEAAAFLRDFRAAGLADTLPLAGPPLLAHAAADAGAGLLTWRTWADARRDPFSALGAHTGAQLAAAAAAGHNDTTRLLTALRGAAPDHALRIDAVQSQLRTALARLEPAAAPTLDFDQHRSGWLHPFLSI